MNMETLDSIEIIDAQIHDPFPGIALNDAEKPLQTLMAVEMAREALDSVGVDRALAVTSEPFIDLAHRRYPGRFPGVHTIWHTLPDLAAEVRRVRAHPAMVAGRALVGNFLDATMRAEFEQGVFDPLYAAAEEVGLPIFNSTHGGCARMARIAERHPRLTLVIDHIGVAQHPVSPPETMSWRSFSDLLALADYPNVAVKLCGAPLLSTQAYPFDDVWPYLEQLFRAFGFDRVMWGSDYTRLRLADLPRGQRPRTRGVSYAESLDFLRRTDRLSLAEKRLLLGGSAQRLLGLSPAGAWAMPPLY
jgi:L-fuconolactonase